MSTSTIVVSGGTGFVGLLQLLFIALELLGLIAWSWWWVLSPLLISFALVVALIVTVILIARRKDREEAAAQS